MKNLHRPRTGSIQTTFYCIVRQYTVQFHIASGIKDLQGSNPVKSEATDTEKSSSRSHRPPAEPTRITSRWATDSLRRPCLSADAFCFFPYQFWSNSTNLHRWRINSSTPPRYILITTVLPTALNLGPVWMPIFLAKRYCSVFVVIWQLVSDHSLIMLKRFVSWISSKLCN